MRWPLGLPSACCGVTLQSTLVPFAGWGASPSPRGTGAPQAWVQSFALTGEAVVSGQNRMRGGACVCLSVCLCAASGAPSFLKAL